MIIWIFAFFLFFLGMRYLSQEFSIFHGLFGFGRQKKLLQKVAATLREIEETLMVGWVPTLEKWEMLRKLPDPWGTLSFDSLQELRACGGSLLPTLKRLRALAEEHEATLADARAKSSQAFAQAMVCSLLVPVVGGALYTLLPGLEKSPKSWGIACSLSFILTGIAALWMFHLAEIARWGGLKAEHRSWVLSSQCAGERFLAWVRAGTPADLAWTRVCQFLAQDSSELSSAWGHSVWEMPPILLKDVADQVIIGAGESIKKAVQISLMEGRPCADRVETALIALKQGLRSQVERELSLLGTRVLKPLFICVAPAILGLLAYGLWLATADVMGDSFGAF